MKIQYALLCYPPSTGGGEIHTHQLARNLIALGQETSVVSQWSEPRRDFLMGTTLRCKRPTRYLHETVQVDQLGFSRFTRLRMLPWVAAFRAASNHGQSLPARRIARLMAPAFTAAVDSADLIHSVRIGHEFLMQAAHDHARRLDLPFVVTPLFHPARHGPRYANEEQIFRKADAIIALTGWEKHALIEKGVPEDRIHVTGCGPVLSPHYSAERFRARFDIKGPYVLFLGRHVKHKGYMSILEAAPLVWRRYPELLFVFVGPGNRYSDRIFSDLTDSRIRQLGHVDLETKTAALADCEMLCMPSNQESFGGVYTEAWSFAKPVIGGRSPAIAHVVEENVSGLLSSQEPGELADRICSLLDDKDIARAMGAAGKEVVSRRYDWTQLALKTLSIYESATGRTAVNAA